MVAKKTNNVKKVTNHKTTNHKPKPEADIHIRVTSPNQVRKQVLALTIEAIEMVKKVKIYKEHKDSKKKLMEDLKLEIEEIKNLTKELSTHELPLNLKQVENLPLFKKEREALQKIEKARVKSEKIWDKEEKTIERDLAKAPKLPPEINEPVPVATTAEAEYKPKDKLESDLDALRAKMAQL